MPFSDAQIIFDANFSQAQSAANAYFAGVNRKAKGALQFTSPKDGISGPLGSITGKANEFTKSLAAANARVLAFGASVGILYSVQRAFFAMAESMISVEKAITDINVLLQISSSQIGKFSSQLFQVANQTGVSFFDAATAAQEFARQGLGVEETLRRTKSAMELTRLSGLELSKSVSSITAAIEGFNQEALTSEEIVNRLAAVDAKYAVSAADLAESLSRVGSTASDVNVSFNELIALVTSARQATGRSGAVIGNAYKTIFTRLARPQVLDDLESIGIATKNTSGEALNAVQILSNLANSYDKLSLAEKSFVTESVASLYQINILKANLKDLGDGASNYAGALDAASESGAFAQKRIADLNKTLATQIQVLKNDFTQAFANVGDIVLRPTIQGGAGQISSILKYLTPVQEGDAERVTAIYKTLEGVLKSVGSFLSGPGLQFAVVVILKLFNQLRQFAVESVRDITGIGTAAQKNKALQEGINQILSNQSSLVTDIRNKTISIDSAVGIVAKRWGEANAAAKQQENIARNIAAILSKTPGVRFIPKAPTKSGGFVPNLMSPVHEEIAGAYEGGYKPGTVKTMNVPNLGKVVYNTAETVKKFPQFDQPAIMPPAASKAGVNYKKEFEKAHGFNPYKAGGLVPNLNFSTFGNALKNLDKYKGFGYRAPFIEGEGQDERIFNSILKHSLDIGVDDIHPNNILFNRKLGKNVLVDIGGISLGSNSPQNFNELRENLPLKELNYNDFFSKGKYIGEGGEHIVHKFGKNIVSMQKDFYGSFEGDLLKNSGRQVLNSKILRKLLKSSGEGKRIGFDVIPSQLVGFKSSGLTPYANKGLVPNLVRKLGEGAYGQFFDLEKRFKGFPLGYKAFKYAGRNVTDEYNISKILEQTPLPNFLGVPKIVGSLKAAERTGKIFKEVIPGKTGKDFINTFDDTTVDGNSSAIFNLSQIFSNFNHSATKVLGERGIKVQDLHQDNYILNQKAQEELAKLSQKSRFFEHINRSEKADDVFDKIFAHIGKKGGKFNIIDPGLFETSSRGSVPNLNAQLGYPELGIPLMAGGHVPNLAAKGERYLPPETLPPNVHGILKQLSDIERRVLIAKGQHQMEDGEISKAVKIPINSVSGIYDQAKRRFAGLYGQALKGRLNYSGGAIPNLSNKDQFLNFLREVNPSYVKSFRGIQKQDTGLAKFIRETSDRKEPVLQKSMGEMLKKKIVQYTPSKYGLDTTGYFNFDESPDALRENVKNAFTKFRKPSPFSKGFVPNLFDTRLLKLINKVTSDKIKIKPSGGFYDDRGVFVTGLAHGPGKGISIAGKKNYKTAAHEFGHNLIYAMGIRKQISKLSQEKAQNIAGNQYYDSGLEHLENLGYGRHEVLEEMMLAGNLNARSLRTNFGLSVKDTVNISRINKILQKKAQNRLFKPGEFRPRVYGGMVPNLFTPEIYDALAREDRATGGYAVLSQSSKLVSPRNPMGFAAIDRRSQKSADEAIIQHKMMGQPMSQIKSAKTSSRGYIPNLVLGSLVGAQDSNIVDSVSLAFLQFGLSMQGVQKHTEGVSKGFRFLLGEQGKQLLRQREFVKAFDDAKASVASGAVKSASFFTDLEKKNKPESRASELGFSNFEQSEKGKQIRSARAAIALADQSSDRNIENTRRTGFKIAIGGAAIAGVGSQLFGKTDAAAGIEKLGANLQASGQILTVFQNKVGKAAAVGVAAFGIVDGLDQLAKGLVAAQTQYDAQVNKIQKTLAALDGLTSSVNRLEDLYNSSSSSLEIINKEYKVFQDNLSKLSQTPEGASIASEIQLATTPAEKQRLIGKGRRASERQKEDADNSLLLTNIAAERKNILSKVPILGDRLGLGFSGTALTANNAANKKRSEEVASSFAGSIIAKLEPSTEKQLIDALNAGNLSGFDEILRGTAGFQSTSKEFLNANKGNQKKANQDLAVISKFVQANIGTKAANQDPIVLQALASSREIKSAAESLLGSALKERGNLERLFLSQGSLGGAAQLSIKSFNSEQATNKVDLNLAHRKGDLQNDIDFQGPITAAFREMALESARIRNEGVSKQDKAEQSTAKSIVDIFSDSGRDLLEKSSIAGGAPRVSQVKQDALGGLNRGIIEAVKGEDFFKAVKSGNADEISRIVTSKSGLNPNSLAGQELDKLIRPLASDDKIVKAMDELRNATVAIGSETNKALNLTSINTGKTVEGINKQKAANAAGGLDLLTDRGIQRKLTRQFNSGSRLFASEDPVIKARGAVKLLQTTLDTGGTIDLNDKDAKAKFDAAVRGLGIKQDDLIKKLNPTNKPGAIRRENLNTELAVRKAFRPEDFGAVDKSRDEFSGISAKITQELNASVTSISSFGQKILDIKAELDRVNFNIEGKGGVREQADLAGAAAAQDFEKELKKASDRLKEFGVTTPDDAKNAIPKGSNQSSLLKTSTGTILAGANLIATILAARRGKATGGEATTATKGIFRRGFDAVKNKFTGKGSDVDFKVPPTSAPGTPTAATTIPKPTVVSQSGKILYGGAAQAALRSGTGRVVANPTSSLPTLGSLQSQKDLAQSNANKAIQTARDKAAQQIREVRNTPTSSYAFGKVDKTSSIDNIRKQAEKTTRSIERGLNTRQDNINAQIKALEPTIGAKPIPNPSVGIGSKLGKGLKSFGANNKVGLGIAAGIALLSASSAQAGEGESQLANSGLEFGKTAGTFIAPTAASYAFNKLGGDSKFGKLGNAAFNPKNGVGLKGNIASNLALAGYDLTRGADFDAGGLQGGIDSALGYGGFIPGAVPHTLVARAGLRAGNELYRANAFGIREPEILEEKTTKQQDVAAEKYFNLVAEDPNKARRQDIGETIARLQRGIRERTANPSYDNNYNAKIQRINEKDRDTISKLKEEFEKLRTEGIKIKPNNNPEGDNQFTQYIQAIKEASGTPQPITIEISIKDADKLPDIFQTKVVGELERALKSLKTRVDGIDDKNPQPATI